MATSHFDHSKSFRPYWENIIACLYGLLEFHNHLAKLQTGLRSVEAISRKFVKVLDSGNLLAKDIIKQETESSIN